MICSAFSAPNRVRCASNRIKSHTIARDSTQSHTPYQKTSYLCISFKTTKSPLTPLSPHSNKPYPACLQACDASKASRRGLEQTPSQHRPNSDSTPTPWERGRPRPPTTKPLNLLNALKALKKTPALRPPITKHSSSHSPFSTFHFPLPFTPFHSLPKKTFTIHNSLITNN